MSDAVFQAAYDKICAAKKQAEDRNRKLDDKRKKIKLGELFFKIVLEFIPGLTQLEKSF